MTDARDDSPGASDGVAADDAGGSALGRRVGETAGGRESFGAGSEGPAAAEEAADVAADDAGATAALQRTERRGD